MEKINVLEGIYSNDLGNYEDSKKSNFITLHELSVYGTSRIEITNDDSKNEAHRRSSVLYGLFNSDGRLLSIEAELIKWEYRNKRHFNNLKKNAATSAG